jgi:MFS family permease
MGLTAFQAYVPLYADQLHLGGSQYVFLLYSAVVLTVRTVGARIPDKLGPPRAAAAAIMINATGLLVIASVGSGPGLYLGSVVFAVGVSLLYPSMMTMAVNSASEHERSAVVGSFTAFFDLAQGTSGFALGAVAAAAGYRAAFGSGAGFALLGLALLRLKVGRVPPVHHHPTSDILAEPDAWMPPGFE